MWSDEGVLAETRASIMTLNLLAANKWLFTNAKLDKVDCVH